MDAVDELVKEPLHLPRMRVDLGKLKLMRGDDLSSFVEDQESGTCRSLVDRSDKGLLGAVHFEVCSRRKMHAIRDEAIDEFSLCSCTCRSVSATWYFNALRG